jgi:RHS repeat-associated protein
MIRNSHPVRNETGVLTVINDIKLPVLAEDGTTINSYSAVVISATDYSAFGVALYGRSWSSESYRYGFNGKEKDSENFAGAYDFGARIYDGRLGRWLSVDPMAIKFTSQSVYMAQGNSPIYFIDPDGKVITGFNEILKRATGWGNAMKIAMESTVFKSFIHQFNDNLKGDNLNNTSGSYSCLNINFSVVSKKEYADIEGKNGLNIIEVFDKVSKSWVSINGYEGDLTSLNKADIRMSVYLNKECTQTATEVNTALHETILHGETTAEMMSSFINATEGETFDATGLKTQYAEKVKTESDHLKIAGGESANYLKAQNEVIAHLNKPGCPDNTAEYVPEGRLRDQAFETYREIGLNPLEKKNLLNHGLVSLSIKLRSTVNVERTFTYNKDQCGKPGCIHPECPDNEKN